ncbi:hypothetical protein QQ056_19485 [Oscillatoria laete-virens NRMC-F 0139]|nr:hypothetical protein [Oscillatoria laete-virens]MDL5055715.1 hypothetical protein [Oscillatoria laete-virens NRMC-F 0139]
MVSRKHFLAIASVFFLGLSSLLAGEKKHDHDEKPGPNGGEVQEIGDGDDHHVEIKHDKASGKATIWILAKDVKTPVAIKEAPKVNLKSKAGNKQLEMVAVKPADAGSAQWEATDDGFKTDHLDGRLQIKLPDGKKYNVNLDAHHGHDH